MHEPQPREMRVKAVGAQQFVVGAGGMQVAAVVYQDAAGIVRYPCTPAAQMISGQLIYGDGGQQMV